MDGGKGGEIDVVSPCEAGTCNEAVALADDRCDWLHWWTAAGGSIRLWHLSTLAGAQLLHRRPSLTQRQLRHLPDLLLHGQHGGVICRTLAFVERVNPFTATGYFDIPPPRWPTFLVTLFPILKEGMGLSLLDEFEVQYHVIKK